MDGNVADLVRAAAVAYPRRPALRYGDVVLRWADVDERVERATARLRSLGVQSHERVAVVLPNIPEFAITFWSGLRAGAVVVPANPAYTPHELAHILGDSGARFAVSLPPFDAAVRAARNDVVILDARGLCAVGADPVPPEVAPPGSAAAGRAETTGDDGACAVICYTSGTTGQPKGARLSHRNFLANLDGFADLPALTLEPDDVLLGVLPFFHIFGLNVILNAAARHGASVLCIDRFSPASAISAAADHGVTVAYGAPPVFSAWNGLPPAAVPPLPTLRSAISGADALPVPTFARFAERFGVTIMEGYGLTETAPVVSSNAASPAVRAGTVGHPLPNIDVRLVDGEGRPVEVNKPGEITVRGPNVFEGYHGRPDATREVTRDGWFHTGDLGAFDDDGYLRIVGRLKDLVIVSGFNVYPREVEEALLAHPAVSEAAVVGLPDGRTGERIHAAVVPATAEGVDVEALLGHCRRRLARYKLPRDIAIVSAIPRLPSGKVARARLRELWEPPA